MPRLLCRVKRWICCKAQDALAGVDSLGRGAGPGISQRRDQMLCHAIRF